MALSDSWQTSAALPVGLTDRHRRQRAFQAARRHSRLVRRLRLLLPVLGGLVVLAFVVATRFALPGNLDLSGARLSVTRNSIIMDNPHITGFDADKREYSVTADRAIQALTNPSAVRLEEITARVKVGTQGSAAISAQSGNFDNRDSTLKLYGGIVVDSSEGYSLRMSDADIDLQAGTMSSENPVSVSYEDSTTTGESMSVSRGGQVIILDGGVRTTLLPPKRAPTSGAMEPAQE